MSYSHLLILLVIFDKNMSLAQPISAVSKSSFHNIRDLRRIRNIFDQTTACTIATSLIRSRIYFCNSLLLNPPATQTNRLQLQQFQQMLHRQPHIISRDCLSHSYNTIK